MSDSRVRVLKQRFEQSQAIEDHAAWLRERARVGELVPTRLRLAAILGDPVASLATAGSPSVTIEDIEVGHLTSDRPELLELYRERYRTRLEAEATIRSLGEFGHEVCVRAGVAAVSLLRPEFDRFTSDPRLIHAAYAAVLDWTECPTQEFAAECERVGNSIRAKVNCWGFKDMAVRALALSASQVDAAEGVRLALESIRDVKSMGTAVEEIVAEITVDLVPWLTGRGDPAAARARALALESD